MPAETEELAKRKREEKEAVRYEAAKDRFPFGATMGAIPELANWLDREAAWTDEMYLKRIDYLMQQYDDKLYMEGDPHFLPDFPRFPSNPQRAIAADEVELKERRRAEVEFVQFAAPALASHLDKNEAWPGPFKIVRDQIREEAERKKDEAQKPELARPAKKSRWGPAPPNGDRK